MEVYLNPGNSGFAELVRSGYVDKTELAVYLNQTIGTNSKLTCVSGPRRFGKSSLAAMLCAYYDKTCDSGKLFDKLHVAASDSYERNLNEYDVLFCKMSPCPPAGGEKGIAQLLSRAIIDELAQAYASVPVDRGLPAALRAAFEAAGGQFVVVVDDWDAPVVEHPLAEAEYFGFLQELLMGLTASKAVALAFMTGTLPISAFARRSTLAGFHEHSVVGSTLYGLSEDCLGFTKEEVDELCKDRGGYRESWGDWCGGYGFGPSPHMTLNPDSLLCAMKSEGHDLSRPAPATLGLSASLLSFVEKHADMSLEGFARQMALIVGGEHVGLNMGDRPHSLSDPKDVDDLMAWMVYHGYLVYSQTYCQAFAPNAEMLAELWDAYLRVGGCEARRLAELSRQLVDDTIDGDNVAVANLFLEFMDEVLAAGQSDLVWGSCEALGAIVRLAYHVYRRLCRVCWDAWPDDDMMTVMYVPDATAQRPPRRRLPALVVELRTRDINCGFARSLSMHGSPSSFEGYCGKVVFVELTYCGNPSWNPSHLKCKVWMGVVNEQEGMRYLSACDGSSYS